MHVDIKKILKKQLNEIMYEKALLKLQWLCLKIQYTAYGNIKTYTLRGRKIQTVRLWNSKNIIISLWLIRIPLGQQWDTLWLKRKDHLDIKYSQHWFLSALLLENWFTPTPATGRVALCQDLTYSSLRAGAWAEVMWFRVEFNQRRPLVSIDFEAGKVFSPFRLLCWQ